MLKKLPPGKSQHFISEQPSAGSWCWWMLCASTTNKGQQQWIPLSLVNTSSIASLPAGIRHSGILHWEDELLQPPTAEQQLQGTENDAFGFVNMVGFHLVRAKRVRSSYKNLQSHWTQSGGDLEYPPAAGLEILSCAKNSSYINHLFIKYVHTHRGSTCCSPRAVTPPCPYCPLPKKKSFPKRSHFPNWRV